MNGIEGVGKPRISDNKVRGKEAGFNRGQGLDFWVEKSIGLQKKPRKMNRAERVKNATSMYSLQPGTYEL